MDEWIANRIIECDKKYKRRFEQLERDFKKYQFHDIYQGRFKELTIERQKRIQTIVKGEDGKNRDYVRENDKGGEIPANKNKEARVDARTSYTNTTI